MNIDTQTISLMKSIESPTLTSISKTISLLFEPIIIITILLAISIFLFYKKENNKAIFLATISAATGILIQILKEIFQRTRPLNGIIQETGYSLPSGHATMSLIFFASLFFIFVKRKSTKNLILIVIIPTLIISLTRIYLRVHYLTDILAGLTLATIILTTTILPFKKSL